MEFTQRLPSEVFLAIFKELDSKTLCSLSLVSKGCNSFAIDNHVWSQLALKRWEGKQGMKEIHSEPHEIWFRKAGTWKKVYGLVEQEARRNKLNTDDLAETTWCFKFNSFEFPHIGTPKFHRNGIYTHREMMGGQLSWKFTNEGQVRVDQFPPLKPYRSTTDWSFKMRNVHITFASTDHNCFRKKLHKFNLNLIEELGLCPSQYILKMPEPSYGILNSSNKGGEESGDENDQETEGSEGNYNEENDNEGNENGEERNIAMDHIMVLPSRRAFHGDDHAEEINQAENVHRGRYVIFFSFPN
ncbi:6188_t:CDS:2 [Funneliformis geosporum]|uniref:9522_t:CDS:1 n=1 Tax=Funneliformis geosporum TaxID=1117311 RepID=A0A9W4SWI2_9GLOM|nr:6188_t:CDS:2 [Funneliformis geosporum]CAI2183956.1 9522_t:CDS:2 [Funneliformis geosporum]